MSAARFACYLRGGCPLGGARTYPGARDPRPARDTRGVWLPGAVYFAGESAVWTGGMAFYDPGAGGHAAARAYLVSAGQFSDVAAQEMYRVPGVDLDLSEVLATGRSVTGPGRYETLVRAGEPRRTPAADVHGADLPLAERADIPERRVPVHARRRPARSSRMGTAPP